MKLSFFLNTELRKWNILDCVLLGYIVSFHDFYFLLPGFLENEPQFKNQFIKTAHRGPENIKQQSLLPLHPSWEASRRRKEQQSKIPVFQGKKITFDD